MRRHSAISLRNLFTRNSLRISQNLSITSSPAPLNSVSSRLGPSHCSESSDSLIFRSAFKFSHENQRRYGTASSGGSPPDVNKVVDEINHKFAEAREDIDMAMDSKESVYFNEEVECARNSVTEVLEMFEDLLGRVTESERASLQRSMGLKLEQLKAELEQLNE